MIHMMMTLNKTAHLKSTYLQPVAYRNYSGF